MKPVNMLIRAHTPGWDSKYIMRLTYKDDDLIIINYFSMLKK